MTEAATIPDAPAVAPVLRLNPALDRRLFAERFARDGFVQIPELFEPALAEELASALKESARWELSYSDDKDAWVRLTPHQLSQLGSDEVSQRWAQLLTRANKGFAYVYLAFPLNDTNGTSGRSDRALWALFQFLNSKEFFEFGQEIIGHPRVDWVDANAYWYRPGDFLTLHADHGGGLRRAAYTIGFTREWRPDWGGQLLFHDKAGEITRGLMPRFNLLTLFKVPQPHSVAQIASYATVPRWTISGWLNERATPAT